MIVQLISVLAFLVSLLYGTRSHALTPFLEPYVGISKLEATQTTTFGSDGSESKNQVVNNGFHLGVRLGCFLGKEYNVFGEYFQGGPYSSVDVVSFSGSSEDKTSNRMFGAGLGANFDVLSISAAFFFKNILDSDGTTSGDLENEKAARVGISLPVSSKKFVRANLDVFIHFLEDDESVSGSNTTKISVQTTAVSLSFPFDF